MSGSYMDCGCCGSTFVGDEDTERTEPTAVELRKGPPGFAGWPLCDECSGHRPGDCATEEEVAA